MSLVQLGSKVHRATTQPVLKKLKVVLVDIHAKAHMRGLANHYLHACLKQRYGAAVEVQHIEIVCPSMSAELTAEHYLGDTLRTLAVHIVDSKPHLIGISCYVWNSIHVLRLKASLRAACDALVVLGGPEIHRDSDFMVQHMSPGELYIEGEGEPPFLTLVGGMLGGDYSPEQVPGAIWRRSTGELAWNPKGQSLDLGELPSTLIGEFATQKVDRSRIICLETMRGCPYRCNFCNYPRNFAKVRFFPIERCLEEIGWLLKQKIPALYLMDATFHVKRDRARQILEFCATHNQGTALFIETRPELLDDEEIELLIAAGVRELELGLQSSDEGVNKIMDRHNRLPAIRRAFEAVGRSLLPIEVGLIHGLPGDSFTTVLDSVDFVINSSDSPFKRYAINSLFVLPATPARLQADEFGMKFDPWPPYEYWSHKSMPVEDRVRASALNNIILGGRDVLEKLVKMASARSKRTTLEHLRELTSTLTEKFSHVLSNHTNRADGSFRYSVANGKGIGKIDPEREKETIMFEVLNAMVSAVGELFDEEERFTMLRFLVFVAQSSDVYHTYGWTHHDEQSFYHQARAWKLDGIEEALEPSKIAVNEKLTRFEVPREFISWLMSPGTDCRRVTKGEVATFYVVQGGDLLVRYGELSERQCKLITIVSSEASGTSSDLRASLGNGHGQDGDDAEVSSILQDLVRRRVLEPREPAGHGLPG